MAKSNGVYSTPARDPAEDSLALALRDRPLSPPPGDFGEKPPGRWHPSIAPTKAPGTEPTTGSSAPSSSQPTVAGYCRLKRSAVGGATGLQPKKIPRKSLEAFITKYGHLPLEQ
jgi:hypothetical protein